MVGLLYEKENSRANPIAEVQSKKQFTAEELSMRRQEMARRRRNLSDKRNEEVKVRIARESPQIGPAPRTFD